jgi:hypothetical protein
MWGQRDAGPYFATEALFMRVNTPLRHQVLAVRGLWDEAGQIDGSTRPNNLLVEINDTAGTVLGFLFEQPGLPGSFLGSKDVALTARDVGSERFEPGMRLTLGYRFENGIAVEVNYHRIAEFKHTAGASILPPDARTNPPGDGVRTDFSDSFVSLPFFNFSPFFAGPDRDVVSNVVIFTDPGTRPVIVVDSAPGLDQAQITAQQLADLVAFGGIAIPAFGIWNAAEIVSISFVQEIWQVELNTRIPICMTENTRTYSIAGFRYIELQEEFELFVQDQDIDGFIAPDNTATYRNRWGNHMYGVQAGMGNEAYLGNGFALSVEGRVGLFANWQKTQVSLTRGDQADEDSVGARSIKNELGIAPLFQVAAYLWWYPVEGVQLRAGYEATGMFGVKRSRNPVDFNVGRLDPHYEELFFRMDGFNLGVAFIF